MNLHRDGDRLLQLLIFNEEFLVSACHQRALITSLPFVHTARRSYRLNDPVRPPDCGNAAGSPAAMLWEAVQTLSFRGRRSRNKVSVGEPAEGSLLVYFLSCAKSELKKIAKRELIFESILCCQCEVFVLGKARGTCVPSCAKLFCYSVTGADMRSEKSVGSAFEKK